MGYWQAIFLGIIQGLTEFLPVSSSGHLVVFQHWLNDQGELQFDPDSPQMIMFDLFVHLGTVLAILVYYRRSLTKYVSGLNSCRHNLNQPVTLYQKNTSFRVTVLAIAATFATGVIYAILGGFIKTTGFKSVPLVAVCWLVTATVLLVTDRHKHVNGSLRNFTLLAALVIGLAQGVALFPGISRSGSTICVALLFGLRRRWAGEFSFLIGVLAICAATLLDAIDFIKSDEVSLAWGPMLAGGVSSAIVGFGALALLIWVVKRAKLKIFAIYCYLIATTTLIAFYGFGWLT
jgi:undecaprenyl-diphosphatase